MNELCSYENLFSNNGQSADFGASIHLMDHDLVAPGLYYNNIFADLPYTTQHQTSQAQLPQSATFSLAQPTPQQRKQHSHAHSVLNNNCSSGEFLSGIHSKTGSTTAESHAHPSSFGSIPFVQIHTTNVQPQKNSFGNVFRRAATSNLEEIKSEPIKSESADSSKEHVAATPTPPARAPSCNSSISRNSSGERAESSAHTDTAGCTERAGSGNTECTITVESVLSDTAATRTECNVLLPVIQKCNHCPFLSLTTIELEVHSTVEHSGNACNNTHKSRVRLSCPGCANVFFEQTSLLVHLREDHLMTAEDSNTIVAAIHATSADDQLTKTSESVSNISSNAPSPKDQAKKSRIYLKNVECLREPQRELMAQTDSSTAENLVLYANECGSGTDLPIGDEVAVMDFLDERSFDKGNNENSNNNNCNYFNNISNITDVSESTRSSQAPKQKISIKSVDVLREPAFLQRDFGLQGFANFINSCDGNMEMPNSETNQFDVANGIENDDGMLLNNGDCDVSYMENLDTQYNAKPHRPKIYIRNVDILKQPMLLPNNLSVPSMPESNSSINFGFIAQPNVQYINSVENLSSAAPTYTDTNIQQLPMVGMPEQYIFDQTTNSYIPNIGDADTFTFSNTTANSNFLLENIRYSNELDCEVDSYSSNTPIITEPTPPPPSVQTLPCTTTAPDVTSIGNILTAAATSQKQKIFIRNVDVMKAPQFQEPRGTLHLRTVDELNLMNKNEVENLIAPNLDNTTNVGGGSKTAANISQDLTDELIYVDENYFKWDDLSGDLDCIITDINGPFENATNTTQSEAQRTIHDLHTPQISLISIRDIEELTSGMQQNNNVNLDRNFDSSCDVSPTQTLTLSTHSNEVAADTLRSNLAPAVVKQDLKQENANAESCTETAASTSTAVVANLEAGTSAATLTSPIVDDVPPLAPVTKVSIQSLGADASAASTSTQTTKRLNTSTIPVPPLVPVSPLIQLNIASLKSSGIASASSSNAQTSTSIATSISSASNMSVTTAPQPFAAPAEKGRIYVANNLMQTASEKPPISSSASALAPAITSADVIAAVAVPLAVGTSVRGRPFGARCTGITKLKKRKQGAQTAEKEVGMKCTAQNCAFRFRKAETLAYHIRCHNSDSSSSMALRICPECKSTEFTNWNCLHTHLWRAHKVDMELYSCQLCSFKTPIYSRLINTHLKIHSDERNYKCDQCGKAFKNTKQLKNHRRWHRNHTSADDARNDSVGGSVESPVLHRCSTCRAVFSHQKSLREHSCKSGGNPVKCPICERVLSSKSSYKLHMLTHELVKRFKCTSCQYATNDHNAFRRHKMIHEIIRMYVCPHCSYKSIQSVAYQKHIQQKHPDMAAEIIHKCTHCPYSTINRTLFAVHKAKHEERNFGPPAPPALVQDNNNYVAVLKPVDGHEITSADVSVSPNNIQDTNIFEKL